MARPIRFKSAIYDSAIRLFGEKGLTQTGIREIAQVAGVSEAALYRHWKGKRELAWDIFRSGLESLHAELVRRVPRDGPFCDAVLVAVGIFFEAYDSNRSLFGYMMLSQHELWKSMGPLSANPVAYWFEMLRERSGEFGLDERLQGDILGPITLGMLLQPSISAAYGSVSLPLAQHAEAVSAAICRVLGVAWMPTEVRTAECPVTARAFAETSGVRSTSDVAGAASE
jgi:AcrR family transcriptional regulator